MGYPFKCMFFFKIYKANQIETLNSIKTMSHEKQTSPMGSVVKETKFSELEYKFILEFTEKTLANCLLAHFNTGMADANSALTHNVHWHCN